MQTYNIGCRFNPRVTVEYRLHSGLFVHVISLQFLRVYFSRLSIHWAVVLCMILATKSVFAERFEFERPEMGVAIRIVVHGDDAKAIEQAAEAAFDRFRTLNAVMSDYDEDSELMLLSRRSSEEFEKTGVLPWIKVSDDLYAVLTASKRFAELSGGAFDITVAPLVRLWRRARRMHELPKPELIAKARELVGNDLWELDEKTQSVRLKKKGVRFDLGGIAKGYAIDRAFEVLQAAGFATVLVDAGGDMRVGKAPPGGWKIAAVGSTDEMVPLENRSLATSGDTYRFVEFAGVRYSHIVDPKTGYGLQSSLIVRVTAPTACEADALASACSVQGPEKSGDLIKSFPEADVRFIGE